MAVNVEEANKQTAYYTVGKNKTPLKDKIKEHKTHKHLYRANTELYRWSGEFIRVKSVPKVSDRNGGQITASPFHPTPSLHRATCVPVDTQAYVFSLFYRVAVKLLPTLISELMSFIRVKKNNNTL